MATLVAATSGHSVHRVRSVLLDSVSGKATVDEHVRVRLPAPECPALLGDVLIGRGTGAPAAVETAAAHPGAMVVAVHRGTRCWLRFGSDGTVAELRLRGVGHQEEVWAAVASLAHSWLVAGLPATEFGSACVVRIHWPSGNCCNRRRADSASSDSDRPEEA